MGCICWFKCQLWENIQIQGLGTALKAFYSEKLIANIAESGPT